MGPKMLELDPVCGEEYASDKTTAVEFKTSGLISTLLKATSFLLRVVSSRVFCFLVSHLLRVYIEFLASGSALHSHITLLSWYQGTLPTSQSGSDSCTLIGEVQVTSWGEGGYRGGAELSGGLCSGNC